MANFGPNVGPSIRGDLKKVVWVPCRLWYKGACKTYDKPYSEHSTVKISLMGFIGAQIRLLIWALWENSFSISVQNNLKTEQNLAYIFHSCESDIKLALTTDKLRLRHSFQSVTLLWETQDKYFPSQHHADYITPVQLQLAKYLFSEVSAFKLCTLILTITTQGLKEVYYTTEILVSTSPPHGFLQGSSLQHK